MDGHNYNNICNFVSNCILAVDSPSLHAVVKNDESFSGWLYFFRKRRYGALEPDSKHPEADENGRPYCAFSPIYGSEQKTGSVPGFAEQINPHFLYNTLESIRGEAIIAGLDSVADMTEALARFFRYTITKVENLVSVEEELDNCETYFGIQKYRFGDRLQLHIDYDIAEYEKIMNCRIPKLTLQPILENSIIHGVELKVGGGNLYIRFQCTKDRLLIRISDDGVGMDEMTLAKHEQKLGKSTKAFHDNEEKQGGIALVNVNNRIHLIFGDEYGMHVYSVPGEGTDVEITIPILTDDRQVKNRSVLA